MLDIQTLNPTMFQQEYLAKAGIYRPFWALVPVPHIPLPRVAAQSGALATVSWKSENGGDFQGNVNRVSQGAVDVTLNTTKTQACEPHQCDRHSIIEKKLNMHPGHNTK